MRFFALKSESQTFQTDRAIVVFVSVAHQTSSRATHVGGKEGGPTASGLAQARAGELLPLWLGTELVVVVVVEVLMVAVAA